jgi:hypothetical protein
MLAGLTSYNGRSSLSYAIDMWGDDEDWDEPQKKEATGIVCKCGCGEEIFYAPSTRRAAQSGYKRGHRQQTEEYKKSRAMRGEVKPRFCECGCGEAIPYLPGVTKRERYEKTRFRPGHSTRRRHRGRA